MDILEFSNNVTQHRVPEQSNENNSPDSNQPPHLLSFYIIKYKTHLIFNNVLVPILALYITLSHNRNIGHLYLSL